LNIAEECGETLSDGKTRRSRGRGRESESERGRVDDNAIDNARDNAEGVRATRVPKKDPERTLVRNSLARRSPPSPALSLRRPTAFAHAAVPCNPRLLRAPLPLPLHDVLLVIPAATVTVEHDHWFTGFTQARYTQLPPLTLQADRNKTSVRWRSVASAGEARNHPGCHRALRPRRPPGYRVARDIRFVGAFSCDSSLAFLLSILFYPTYTRSFPVSPRST